MLSTERVKGAFVRRLGGENQLVVMKEFATNAESYFHVVD